jgi:segregation and condensation protein A
MVLDPKKHDKFNVHINDFDGPLELLIHLIKKSKMDISDIKIETITEQYMQYLQNMNDLNFDVAGEYFVMAANLMSIKSKMLLSRDIDEEDDDYEDPREDLMNQLLVYQEYKEVAKLLKKKALANNQYHSSQPSLPQLAQHSLEISDRQSLNRMLLYDAYHNLMLKNKQQSYVHTVKQWQYTVKEQRDYVMYQVTKHNNIEFHALLQDDNDLELVVTTFLSLLELVRKHELIVKQQQQNIYLTKRKLGEN